MDCHFLLQGIVLTQELNPGLLHWQADSLPTELPGKPDFFIPNTYRNPQLVYIYRMQRSSWVILIQFYNNTEISKADISLTWYRQGNWLREAKWLTWGHTANHGMTGVGQEHKPLTLNSVLPPMPHSAFQKIGTTDTLATLSASSIGGEVIIGIMVIFIPAFPASLEPRGGCLAKFWPMRWK